LTYYLQLAIDTIQLQIELVLNDRYTVLEGQCLPKARIFSNQI